MVKKTKTWVIALLLTALLLIGGVLMHESYKQPTKPTFETLW